MTRLLFYFIVAYLPFQLALNLSSEVDLLSGRLLVLSLFFVWAAQWAKEKECKSARNRIALALLLFFALAAVSLLGAQNQIWGGRKLLVFVSTFPLFFVARGLIQTGRGLKKVAWILIGGAGLHALIALFQFLAQFVFSRETISAFYGAYIGPYFWGANFSRLVLSDPSWFVAAGGRTLMRAIGLFPDPHTMAFYLGLISPLALGMLLFAGERKKLLFTVYCLLFTVLLLTFSRGGYLGLAASLIVFFVYSWQRLTAGGRKFVFGFLGVILVLALIFDAPVGARFFSSFDLSEGSNFGRLEIWKESLGVAAQNLILGVGLGNYPLAAGASDLYRNAATSHNVYLDILAETGVFGLAAWLAVLLFAAAALRENMKNGKMAADIFGISAGLLAAIAYFLVHSFFETPIFNPTILAILMIILAMGSVASKSFINHNS